MVEKVADAVKAAMKDAGIGDPKDVHYVQTKTPLLTIDAVIDAEKRGHDVACEVHDSMGVSNGTTALGIAVALGEIKMPQRRADLQRPRPLFIRRVVLVRRRADAGADRAARQQARAPAGAIASATP